MDLPGGTGRKCGNRQGDRSSGPRFETRTDEYENNVLSVSVPEGRSNQHLVKIPAFWSVTLCL